MTNIISKWPSQPTLYYLNIFNTGETPFYYCLYGNFRKCDFVEYSKDYYNNYLCELQEANAWYIETDLSDPREVVKQHPELFI